SVDEGKAAHKRLDPKAELPTGWQRRLVAFSRAAGKLPYEVPVEYRGAIRTYQDIYYRPENRDPEREQEARRWAAAEGASFARRFLPAGARVNGNTLPIDHEPKLPLPILPEAGKIHERSSNPNSAIPRLARSHRTHNGPAHDR
ncbi:MAG: hypothetical protein PHP75_09895, partial [Methylacidiphilaceae bacterium]|nr:hypothetical protein [Candidatus Methylacidiphilaceae bacterium]